MNHQKVFMKIARNTWNIREPPMKFVMQTYQIIFEFLFLLQALEVATVMTLTSFAIIMELWTLASLLGLKAF